MYLEFLKLREYPFRLTPDIDFLYLSHGHARAKAYMKYTVCNRDGFVVITGDIGCGKTTLVQKIISELGSDTLVAKIFQTQLDEVEFLQALLVEFGLNPFSAKKVELLDMLNSFMIEQFHQHRQLVLIVDDAHNLSTTVLEEIRMLSGVETRKEKVLHVILVGQPPLNETLAAPELEQLLQRVRLRYHIAPLSLAETEAYITHRLKVAGMGEPPLFAPATFPLIHKYSGGLPRLINTLCDTALVCAYADRLPGVTQTVLQNAIVELRWRPYAKREHPLRTAGASSNEHDERRRHQTRLMSRVAQQTAQLDALVPALNALTSRMGSIESLLRQIAGQLPNAVPQRGSGAVKYD